MSSFPGQQSDRNAGKIHGLSMLDPRAIGEKGQALTKACKNCSVKDRRTTHCAHDDMVYGDTAIVVFG